MQRNVTLRSIAAGTLVTIGVGTAVLGSADSASAKRLPVLEQPVNDTVTVASAPNAPQVTGTSVTSAGYTIRFTDTADNEAGFRLQKSTDYGTTWVDVAGSDAAALEGTGSTWGMVRTARTSVSYGTQLRVVAFNDAGFSAGATQTCC